MAVTDAELPAQTEETVPNQVDEIVSLIGPKLRGLRTAQRHSLQQLAAISDVSAAAIHKIERNGMVPTITTLLKLGAALGVPVSYFVEEDEQPVRRDFAAPEPLQRLHAVARDPERIRDLALGERALDVHDVHLVVLDQKDVQLTVIQASAPSHRDPWARGS